MLINLSEVFSNEVFEEQIKKKLDIKSIKFGNEESHIVNGVLIDLSLKKLGDGQIAIEGHLETILDLNCDRCNDPVKYNLAVDFSKEIKLDKVIEVNEEDEFIQGSYLNIHKLAESEIFLNYPMKVLCQEECQGFCDKCGINLNKNTCTCDQHNIDPRLEGLKALFDENFKEV